MIFKKTAFILVGIALLYTDQTFSSMIPTGASLSSSSTSSSNSNPISKTDLKREVGQDTQLETKMAVASYTGTVDTTEVSSGSLAVGDEEQVYEIVAEEPGDENTKKIVDRTNLSVKYMNHSGLLKELRELEDAKNKKKLDLNSAQLNGVKLAEINSILNKIEENKKNNKKLSQEFEKYLSDKFGNIRPFTAKIQKIVQFCNAMHYLDIKIISELALQFLAKILQTNVSKYCADSEIVAALNSLARELQTKITTDLIHAHKNSFEIISQALPRFVTPEHFLGNCTSETDPVTLAWSPDGTQIATSGHNNNIISVWDAGTGVDRRELVGHTNRVVYISWSPDGRFIASASDDSTIRLWDSSEYVQIAELRGHRSATVCVEWTHDSSQIISASNDGDIIWWNVANCRMIRTANKPKIAKIKLSPDGKYLAFGCERGSFGIMDAKTGLFLSEVVCDKEKSHVASLSWAADSKYLLVSPTDNLKIMLWDLEQNNYRKLDVHGDRAYLSPDNKYFITGNGNDIYLYNCHTQSMVGRAPIKGHTSGIYDMRWTSCGEKFASTATDKRSLVWNLGSLFKRQRELSSLTIDQMLLLFKVTDAIANKTEIVLSDTESSLLNLFPEALELPLRNSIEFSRKEFEAMSKMAQERLEIARAQKVEDEKYKAAAAAKKVQADDDKQKLVKAARARFIRRATAVATVAVVGGLAWKFWPKKSK